MDHPEGAGLQRADRVDFDPRVLLEFRGTQLSSDGGLLVMRELDGALGPSDLAAVALRDTRRGKNIVHRLDGLFRSYTPTAVMNFITVIASSQNQQINQNF